VAWFPIPGEELVVTPVSFLDVTRPPSAYPVHGIVAEEFQVNPRG